MQKEGQTNMPVILSKKHDFGKKFLTTDWLDLKFAFKLNLTLFS